MEVKAEYRIQQLVKNLQLGVTDSFGLRTVVFITTYLFYIAEILEGVK